MKKGLETNVTGTSDKIATRAPDGMKSLADTLSAMAGKRGGQIGESGTWSDSKSINDLAKDGISKKIDEARSLNRQKALDANRAGEAADDKVAKRAPDGARSFADTLSSVAGKRGSHIGEAGTWTDAKSINELAKDGISRKIDEARAANLLKRPEAGREHVGHSQEQFKPDERAADKQKPMTLGDVFKEAAEKLKKGTEKVTENFKEGLSQGVFLAGEASDKVGKFMNSDTGKTLRELTLHLTGLANPDQVRQHQDERGMEVYRVTHEADERNRRELEKRAADKAYEERKRAEDDKRR
jgi:hypothetical protein